MIYPIIPYGNPILRQKAAPIEPGTDLQRLVQDMFLTMDAIDAAGLAAPQVGISGQLFVVHAGPYEETSNSEPKNPKRVYINPTLEILEPNTIIYREEGCMSVPGIYVNVPRSRRIRIKFFDIHWQEQEEEATDLLARIIQHEYDHLIGKLNIDYAGATMRLLLKRKLENIQRGKVQVNYSMRFK